MAAPLRIYETEHKIDVAAPASAVYALLADVTRWPVYFGPTIHARQLERDGTTERIRLWATANDEPKTWTSRRDLDEDGLRIDFRQEVSQHPVASMTGAWNIQAGGPDSCTVVLEHAFSAVGDLPENVEWVSKAVDRNSEHELENLRGIAEGLAETEELTTVFADSVDINADAASVYEFLYRSDLWPERLPHVQRLDLTEDTPGLQVMEMDTKTATGAVHTTKSVRVCFDDEHAIAYKQQVLPALMTVHNGLWTIVPLPDGGVRATSEHTVVIKRDAVEQILGEGKTVEDAKAFVRNALGTNSSATLNLAKAWAEDRVNG
ncbi:aromatase/cyclase [Amycolatopsis sp. WGS_07]|uniref:aromatase/cyclase n=1 Tax=Amycolatopsis sp. WGS_07 TaxID=3076764 RepID=UPI003872AFE0